MSDIPSETPHGATMLRLFIALETTPDVQEAMAEARRALRRRGELPVRWVQPAHAHLTLVFLGNVMAAHLPPLVEAMQPITARHSPFLLRIEGIGAFPSAEEPRVLWLGVGDAVAVLLRLQHEIAQAVFALPGIVADRKPFRPHLTLGRVATGRKDVPGVASVAAALARPVAVPPVGWPIASFALIRSVLGAGGPRYTVVERFPLVAGEQTR